jgi:hypothetical protein
MLGLNKFKGMFTQSLQAGPNTSGEVLLSIPNFIHCHKKLLVYIGDGLIEKGILSENKSVNGTREKITARTLVRICETVSCNCKKVAIVRAKGPPYKDGTFPSGTNWEDYILSCLVKMGKECDRGEAEKVDTALKEAVAEKATANDVGRGEEDLEEEEEAGGPAVASNSTSDSFLADNYPNATTLFSFNFFVQPHSVISFLVIFSRGTTVGLHHDQHRFFHHLRCLISVHFF